MSDNTTLDPGAGGDTIATDDVSGVKYQRVKLVNGTLDATDAIPGDASNGLDVDVTRSVLPTGAATAAKQPALGTAGSASADVITVQGVASMTPLLVNGSGVTQPVSGPLTDAQLRGTPVPISGTVTANGAVTNAGTFAVQDSEKIADDAAFVVATTKVTPVGYLADQVSTDSVNEGDIGAARMTLDRKQIVVLASSVDTEGYTTNVNVDIDESEDAVKVTAGKLHGWYLYNDGATEVYVKFYNDTVANVAVGTTAPLVTLPIPAGAAANLINDVGIPFSAAITIAATTGAATADTGAPATGQVVGTIFYV